VRWEQKLALLFVRSGWTQEELAKREGKSRQWIEKYVRFGAFLTFATTVANPETLPISLTEGRFRTYWDATDKCGGNERQWDCSAGHGCLHDGKHHIRVLRSADLESQPRQTAAGARRHRHACVRREPRLHLTRNIACGAHVDVVEVPPRGAAG
jgi:hypothetical protein